MRDVSCVVLFVVFFKDTATTEIYTYGHTLSLPDALPICRDRDQRAAQGHRRAPRGAERAGWRRRRPAPPGRGRALRGGEDLGRGCVARIDRSEEHTSELQSLMRISYAVFCLKKNKTEQQQPIMRHIDIERVQYTTP